MNQTDWIELYLNAVAERLPEDTREDVKNELRANIEDMLPDNPTEEDIRNVLGRLGNPAKLANEYRQTKRYLIGPDLYDNYISVLKLVIGIAVIVFAFIGMLEHIANPPHSISDSVDFAVNADTGVVSAVFDGAIQAFIWVTVVFAMLERAGLGEGKLSFSKKAWSVDDLPDSVIPTKSRINRAEAIVEIVFTVIFTAILIFQPELFGWYEKRSSSGIFILPVFNLARLQSYTPVIILLFAVNFILSVYKLIVLRWKLPLAIANTINNIAVSVFVLVMLSDRSSISQGFLSRIAEVVKKPAADVAKGFYGLLTVLIIIVIVFSAIDSVSGFVKSRRTRLTSMKIN